MKNQLKVFEKVTRETLVLHYGNNGEWWFMDEKGVFVGGYFSSYVMAHQWANSQGFSMSTPAQTEQQPEQSGLPDVCDGKEQEAFEKFARGERMDTTTHPLHWLFLNEKTNAARQGWKAAIRYCRAALSAQEK